MPKNIPTICHATAPTSHPAQLSKNPANAIFSGSGTGLGPRVFAINGVYCMIYAGLKGSGWNRVLAVQRGLAVAKMT